MQHSNLNRRQGPKSILTNVLAPEMLVEAPRFRINRDQVAMANKSGSLVSPADLDMFIDGFSTN